MTYYLLRFPPFSCSSYQHTNFAQSKNTNNTGEERLTPQHPPSLSHSHTLSANSISVNTTKEHSQRTAKPTNMRFPFTSIRAAATSTTSTSRCARARAGLITATTTRRSKRFSSLSLIVAASSSSTAAAFYSTTIRSSVSTISTTTTSSIGGCYYQSSSLCRRSFTSTPSLSSSESESEFESSSSSLLYPDIRSYDKQYIHGKWIHSTRNQDTNPNERTLNVIDSNTSNIIATIPNGTKQDTIKAITAANTALPKWRSTPLKIRLKYIRTFLEKIELHREEINNRLSVELGCTKKFANDAQLGSLIGHTITVLNLLDTDNENENDDNGNNKDESKFQWDYAAGKCTVVKEPIGVVGCITPWNYPLNQIALKVIPALLAGCTVVLKPSEITPLCAYSVCEAFHDSELPPGVFNMVMGKGPECGEILAAHENVNLVSFTGSTHAGQILTKVAAESGTMKPIKTELGGKSASLLLDDANFDKVVPVYVKQLTSNTGQSCNALSRMIVPRSAYQKVVELCIQTMKTEIIGDSRYNSKATIGPLVSQKQYQSVISLITSGIQEDGATLLYGGLEKPSNIVESKENENGYFVQPTLFGDVTNDMIIARTEIFGPVLCLIPYDTVEEGIEIANDTPYGLNNAVASNDIQKALQVAAQLQSGMVMINHTNLDLKAPFGGYKLSGNAREWGESGLDEFLITKMINMDINEYRKNK